MKERPILFSGSMVRALIAGTKTQTRRVVKLQPDSTHSGFPYWNVGGYRASWCRSEADGGPLVPANPLLCPYGQPGDRLWVRESWAPNSGSAGGFLYRADHGSASSYHRIDLKTGVWTHAASRWRPSIHMPRTASRITLEITSVRVERLQDISQADAQAEGAPPGHPSIDQISREFGYPDFPRSWYAQLWEEINGPGAWAQNPWVWVVEFKRVQQASSGRPSQLEDAPCSA